MRVRGRRRGGSAVAGVRESTPQFLRDARKWRRGACFVRALRSGPRAGALCRRRHRARGIGRLLWLFRQAAELRILPVGTSVVEFAPQDFREIQRVYGRGPETILR